MFRYSHRTGSRLWLALQLIIVNYLLPITYYLLPITYSLFIFDSTTLVTLEFVERNFAGGICIDDFLTHFSYRNLETVRLKLLLRLL
jgi:hypothetical protein